MRKLEEMLVAGFLESPSAVELCRRGALWADRRKTIFLDFHQGLAAGWRQPELPVWLVGWHDDFVVGGFARGQAVAGDAAGDGQIENRDGEVGADAPAKDRV